jgi:16S rRNA processing protein RimM
MIERDEIDKIGNFNKPHGVKGEISFSFSDDSFDESECPFLICEMDGIYVPFKMEACRFKSASTALIKLKNIDSEEKAKTLANKEVYFPKKYLREKIEENMYSWDYFIGFSLVDKQSGKIGTIIDIDDSTLNTLFIVAGNEGEILIPANDEIIIHIDEKQKEIQIELPEGILDI